MDFAGKHLRMSIYPKLVALVAMEYPELHQTDIHLIVQDHQMDKHFVDYRFLRTVVDGMSISITDHIHIGAVFSDLALHLEAATNVLKLMLRRTNEDNLNDMENILLILPHLINGDKRL
jgi:hypothetical protein